MPLGVREVLLVVRAQNLGSGVLRNLAGDFNNLQGAAKKAAEQQMHTGSSLMAIGTAIGAVGAAGLMFLGKATSSAIEYNKQVALTKTQMYGVKASFNDVADAGLEVARKIAVPLDQIQGGLYDIFSSMDVNLTQAKFLLTNFSKEAVAGQVDLSVAERATIGIMNAYGMKVQDVTKVQDIMFNLVKYGVGTYEDFANSIGRVTGPAVRQNQTFEQTAALMAFVTRNGLSAANAASTVGRALDAIGKSRDKIQSIGATVEDALGVSTAHKLGFTHDQMIKVTDAAGRMLPINVIMTNMGKALHGLNPTQLNDVLTTMFKGTGGTIQAMRFFDIAIHNFGQLNTMVKNMANSKGALKAAYDIMSNTPAAKIQLLKNNFQAFMIVLGQQLLPIVKKVAEVLAGFFKFLGTLPRPVIQIIAIIVGVTSVLLVLAGIVMIVVGAWLVFSALIAATDVALVPIAVTIGLVIAAVVALAVAAYFIVKYWGPISTWFHNMWFAMWKWIDHIWRSIVKSITDAWNNVMKVYHKIMTFITTSFDTWWKTHGDAIKSIWQSTWNDTTGIVKDAWATIEAIIKTAWGVISAIEKTGLAFVELAIKNSWAVIEGIFRVAWAVILAGYKIWLGAIETVGKIGWAAIKAILKIAWDTIVVIFSVFLDVITGHWKTAWLDIKNYGIQVWNAIKGFLQATWNALKSLAGTIFNALKQLVVTVWHSLYDTTKTVWNNIKSFLGQVWSGIKSGAKTTVDGLKTIWGGLQNAFKVPVNFVIGTVYDKGIKALWNTVMNAIGLKKFDLPNVKTLAAGGRLPGFGGGDRIPALLEAGETVIDKNRSRKWAGLFTMMGVPGYAKGGVVGQSPPVNLHTGVSNTIGGSPLGPLGGVLHLAGAVGKMTLAAASGNETAFANALVSALGIKSGPSSDIAAMMATLPVAMAKKAISGIWDAIMASGGGSGNSIVQYAMQWLGKIPYVWGGTSVPGGADCSGFVQAVYKYFGINAPRTSEAQGAWVKRGAPTPGGLAFYHSPPGGPDPGHVAIVKDLNHVISQGGGMGPQLIGINALPLLWTGTPPGGFGKAASLAGGLTGSYQRIAQQLLAMYGWGSQWGPFNSLETREANWILTATNPSSGAYGLAQFINGPSEYYQYGGNPNTAQGQLLAMMNYIGSRYGSPASAWNHEVNFGWYDRGGKLKPGWTLAYNGTGKDENVGGGNHQTIIIHTNEINPRRHAAELGWELARRSG